MSDVATSYDLVPYDSKPLFATHPGCLAAAARLRGLAAPDPSRCRVLELGCGTGGNLLAMAYALPQSHFVGVDLSARQIGWGQSVADEAGLDNLELRAMSILDVDARWGSFDYILCHGVYSWVPPPVQEHILWICRHLLTPQGVAYVSYNTYPGWHLRAVVRDVAQFHAARVDDPSQKIQQVRAIVQFLAEAGTNVPSPLARCLAEEAQALTESPDYYIYHEFLEDSNQPLYFHQFVARARAVGLEYLGEAWHHSPFDNLPPQVQQTLQALSRDLVELEQWFDFLYGRTFRRTLLCRAEVPIDRTPSPDVIRPLWLSALARPQSPQPDVTSEQPERFVKDDGSGATTSLPLLKAALVELYRRWPTAVPFTELLAKAIDEVGLPDAQRTQAEALLASLLVRSYLGNLVAIHCRPFPFTLQPGERPRASQLARVLAQRQPRVPNLRHHLVHLTPAQQLVLTLADGQHTRRQIAQALEAAAGQRGPPEDQRKGPSGSPPAEEQVERVLWELAHSALLEA